MDTWPTGHYDLAYMESKYTQKQQKYLKKLGLRIRQVREEQGLSQEQLALKAGGDRSYMGCVERGERNISALNLQKIADALDLSISALMKEL